ncbi:MAG: YciI family protein [Parvibaculum sp.]|uniref:YciI family protein n=1 Tax=Parvibaculum sp. TaxID=2024848 RepID=UPI003C718DE7
MLYLDILKYVRPVAEVDAHLEAHREWLRQGFDEGLVLMAGRRDPRVGGVILIKASSIEEARSYAEADPFITAGVAEYDLIAWEPTLRTADTPEHWGPAARIMGD